MKYQHQPTVFLLVVILTGAAALLSGCNSTEVGNPDSGNYSVSGDMSTFNEDTELEAYLIDQYTKSIAAPEYYNSTDAIADDSAGAPVSENSDGFTGTNLQEAGVDESDVVKTDGQYFYVARQASIVAVDIADPLQVVGSMTIDGQVRSLYLYDSTLVALYTPANGEGAYWGDIGVATDEFFGLPYWVPMRARNGIALFDVSDPSAPELLRVVETDGHLVSSRRIENRLYVVQHFLPNIPYPCGPVCMQDMRLTELMPGYRDMDAAGNLRKEGRLVQNRNFYRTGVDAGGSIVSIVTVDLDQPQADFKSVGVVADAEVVYASTQALYLTATRWHYAENFDAEYTEQTVIVKFDLTQADVRGLGYSSVKGRILNQFSLSEHEGTLRIATTTGWTWGPEPNAQNHLFCLQSKEDGFGVVGRLEGIAPGEQLYATRFVGDKGFLVTFLNIDPLFTLDLSDPTAPGLVGELKVPGYSTYLHALGDDHLIAIGKDALVENGQAFYQGLQLSVFDVGDFSSPQLLFSEIIGTRGTHSEALYNHKAFTFWREHGLLAFPVDLYLHEAPPEEPWYSGTHTLSGLYVYRVGIEEGFEFLGGIDTERGQTGYTQDWTRGVFIDDKIYALTPEAVFSAETENIDDTMESISLGGE